MKNKDRKEEFPEKPDNSLILCKVGLLNGQFDAKIMLSGKLTALFPLNQTGRPKNC